MLLPSLIAIAGPTASGKSALALRLAAERRGTIINADASQVYADLSILSARPTPAEEAAVPHRLFGTIDGARACTAAHWAELAKAAIAEAQGEGRTPILVGGTGLYLRTLLDGIAPVSPVNAAVRAAIRALPPPEVRAALQAEDPQMAARLHPNDSQRNARALEVWRSTGRSLAAWQQAPAEGGIGAAHAVEAMVVEIDRATLVERIDRREEQMWAEGALDEARQLAGRHLPPSLPVMRAIGVPPLLALLAGACTEAEALERWKLDTRQYAKRQATWMRNQFTHWRRVTPIADSPAS